MEWYWWVLIVWVVLIPISKWALDKMDRAGVPGPNPMRSPETQRRMDQERQLAATLRRLAAQSEPEEFVTAIAPTVIARSTNARSFLEMMEHDPVLQDGYAVQLLETVVSDGVETARRFYSDFELEPVFYDIAVYDEIAPMLPIADGLREYASAYMHEKLAADVNVQGREEAHQERARMRQIVTEVDDMGVATRRATQHLPSRQKDE